LQLAGGPPFLAAMGQMLDRPITEKDSSCAPPSGGLNLAWAATCMQGWRIGMEDAHICLPALPSDSYWASIGLFGVMDGHGGEQVAKFCERHLPEELCKFPLDASRGARDLAAALRGTFHRMDELLLDRQTSGPELQALTNKRVPEAAGKMPAGSRPVDPDLVGCTACFCCVTDTQLVVANAGDSRAVLCRAGCAVALSEDHKPNSTTELERIEAAGGYVENSAPGQYRVNGNLNLSRAIGDLEYKKDAARKPEEQIICSTPDVTFHPRCEEDEFVVICCDGVWDVKTNQEVVDFVRDRIGTDREPDPQRMVQALEDLLDSCVSPDLRLTKGLGGDNMTAVVVRLPTAGSSARSAMPNGHSPELQATELQQASFAPAPAFPAAGDRHSSVRLADVKLEPAATEAARGALVLHVALPAGCALADLSFRVSEVTAKIEVGVAARVPDSTGAAAGHDVRVFNLQEHLPEGVELSPATDAGPQVRYFAKSDTLKVSLPWRRIA